MSEEVKKLYEELVEYANGGMSGLYPSEEDVKIFIDYIEKLQQENKELEYKLSKIIKSGEISFYDKDGKEIAHINKYSPIDNILNELESWLEEAEKRYKLEPIVAGTILAVKNHLKELKGEVND